MLEAALDAAGLDRAVIGLGDADLYRQLLDRARGRGRGARRDPRPPRHARPRRPRGGARRARGHRRPSRRDLRRPAQLRGGSEVLERARELGGDAVERATARLGETYEAARGARRRRPGPDRPRPAARPRLLQRRDPRGLRPGARPRPRRRRPLRRPAEPLRRSTCRRPASPSTSSASTSPRPRRSGSTGGRVDGADVAGATGRSRTAR